MSETTGVTRANAAFYRAFETLDTTEMEQRWLQARHIKCIHPGWPLLQGWGPIMASWPRIFANTVAMRFTLSEVQVEVAGSLGWVVLTEDLVSQGYNGGSTSRILTTNVFEKYRGAWLIVHHHASPIFAPPARGGDQLH